MDLSRMTREELEQEATRRGVREVTHLTRAQLIRAIEAPPATGAIDTAKAIFRGVLGVARTLRGRSSPPPPPTPSAPRRDPLPPSSPPSVEAAASTGGEGRGDTQRMRVSETPAGLPAVSRPAGGPEASELPPRPSVEVEPRPTLERTDPTNKMKLPSFSEDAAPETSPESSTTPAVEQPRHTAVTMDLGPLRDEILRVADEQQLLTKAAARREAAVTVPIRVPRELEDEPIPTRTMARLLHEQGHHRRALAILENLLAERPGDVGLEADLAAVQHALGLPRAPLVAGGRVDSSPRAELVTMLLPDRRVLLAWGLSEESIASARTMGASGTLVARVLVLAPGGDGAVTRTLTDKEVQPSGEHTLGPIAPGSFVTAAVGFRDGDQFVSVAAAPVLDVV
ncbi:MAG: hypothetical protein IPG17_03775 [Sandaracinaceae bacterium]|nr:hypothetical protein [Sandaracinaceae bacterium]MBK7152086.1 hypothetical protein [Sandaracinaceae bacterium]MBK8410977.1 hypothetical protein [Sandaracinaceae bacterium]MBK8587786.1 hypothetical protein [Sandaracinaceae bacterium]